MKTQQKVKSLPGRIEAKILTLGDLIAATYTACGEHLAPKVLQLAIDSHLVRFRQAYITGETFGIPASKSA